MKFKQLGVLLSISIVIGINIVTTKALAKDPPKIQFGEAITSGGCIVADQPSGSDGKTLSLIFDKMSAINGKRQRCLLRVDTIIPSGFYIQDVQVLYQGSTEVTPGSSGTSLSRSYIFNGGNLGVNNNKPESTNFTSSNPLFEIKDSFAFTPASCGGQGQLGINIIAQSSKGSLIILGRGDLNGSGVEMHINIAPC